MAGLSARGARVTLRYPEGAERLADALAQQGLSLRNAGGNWVLVAAIGPSTGAVRWRLSSGG